MHEDVSGADNGTFSMGGLPWIGDANKSLALCLIDDCESLGEELFLYSWD